MHERSLCLLRLYLIAVKCCLICMVLLVCRVDGGAATSFSSCSLLLLRYRASDGNVDIRGVKYTNETCTCIWSNQSRYI